MSNIQVIHDEIMADLRLKGFGGYVDRLYDYKNIGDTTSVNRPKSNTPKNENTNTKRKNVEEAAALPPGCLLLPFEVL